jgi:hypothetical protein
MQPWETSIRPRGCHAEPIAMDSEGILPGALERAVEASSTASVSGKPARVLYVVPHCQNPTGGTMSMQRKQEIYSACQKHNILIIEDDPYLYLQFPSQAGAPMPGVPAFCATAAHTRSAHAAHACCTTTAHAHAIMAATKQWAVWGLQQTQLRAFYGYRCMHCCMASRMHGACMPWLQLCVAAELPAVRARRHVSMAPRTRLQGWMWTQASCRWIRKAA